MVEDNPRDLGHEMDELSIVYGDESLPRLYENSRISSDQLPGQSGMFTSFLFIANFLGLTFLFKGKIHPVELLLKIVVIVRHS